MSVGSGLLVGYRSTNLNIETPVSSLPKSPHYCLATITSPGCSNPLRVTRTGRARASWSLAN